MPRIRSISDAFKALKNDDPETAMTLSGLRRLVSTKKIASIQIGRRIMVDYDSIIEFLRNPAVPEKDNDQGHYGQIRKIEK